MHRVANLICVTSNLEHFLAATLGDVHIYLMEVRKNIRYVVLIPKIWTEMETKWLELLDI